MEALLLCCLHQFGSPPFQGSVWGRHVLTRSWKFPGNVLGTEWYCLKTLWPKLGFLLHILFFGRHPLWWYWLQNIDVWMWVSSAEFYFQTQVQSASGLIPHPLILIFDKPNQLRLLDWSAVSFNYYYSLTSRITGRSNLVACYRSVPTRLCCFILTLSRPLSLSPWSLP